MKVVLREAAEDDLDRIFVWISKDNPVAAADLIARIRDRISLLELDSLAHMGGRGLVEGTRELVEYLTSSSTALTKIGKRSLWSQSFMARKIASSKA
jgi:plasmid stabilization system protein ParE